MNRKELPGNIVKLALLGFVLGVTGGTLIEIIVSLCLNKETLMFTSTLLEKTGSPLYAFTVQTVLLGLFGSLSFIPIIVYDMENIGLLWATVSHWAVIVTGFIPVSIYLGYVASVKEAGFMIAYQTFAFAIIWLVMYAKCRAEVNELNRLLQNCDPAGRV